MEAGEHSAVDPIRRGRGNQKDKESVPQHSSAQVHEGFVFFVHEVTDANYVGTSSGVHWFARTDESGP